MANRLAELFDKAQEGANEAYWLLVATEELRNKIKDIAGNPAVSNTKELAVALDSVTWLYGGAENIESEFETLSDAICSLELTSLATTGRKTA